MSEPLFTNKSQQNFWIKLIFSASLLAAIGLISSRREMKALFTFKIRHLWVGIVSALVLYGIFRVGKEAANFLFSFAPGQIASVYATKTQLDTALIGLFLMFLMGPAEEIYWHGFVQRRLVGRYGAKVGVLGTAVVYALVHAVSMNPMLILAAGASAARSPFPTVNGRQESSLAGRLSDAGRLDSRWRLIFAKP